MKGVSSPLRYPGGKSKAIKKILPRIPSSFSEYREPFLGGGSVFIAVRKCHPNATYKINDLNQDLCCFWNGVKNDVDDLISEIVKIKTRFKDGKRLYEKFASDDPQDDFHKAVRFYVLNRITYSGTVDSGGYSSQAFTRRFTFSNIRKLRPLSDLLRGVTITNESYESMILEDGKDVFIYLDPPYWRSRKSKLYGKNGDLHKSFDHRQFAEKMKKCRHRWLITYDDSDLIRQFFAFANVFTWKMHYGMSNVNRSKVRRGKELFITNFTQNEEISRTGTGANDEKSTF